MHLPARIACRGAPPRLQTCSLQHLPSPAALGIYAILSFAMDGPAAPISALLGGWGQGAVLMCGWAMQCTCTSWHVHTSVGSL